jgi:hypothetical protein
VFTAFSQWNILTASFNRSGNIELFLNGVSQGTASISGLGKLSAGGTLRLGALSYSVTNYYQGLLGEVQIVRSYAMTAAEIAVIYQSGIQDSYASGTIAAHYKFRGTTDAAMLSDYSGNGNTLTGTNVTIADQVVGDYQTIDSLGTITEEGMLIESIDSSGVGGSTYAKVTAIDTTSNTLTVDEWSNGTPTDGQALVLSGCVVDLPRTQETTEILSPDVLVHNLWRSRKSAKFYGWFYQCILDYARYLDADTLLSLAPLFSMEETDTLILIPRRDAPELQYNVFWSAPISLSLYGRSPGYRKPVFILDAKDTVASWPPVDEGYGSNYAESYGESL